MRMDQAPALDGTNDRARPRYGRGGSIYLIDARADRSRDRTTTGHASNNINNNADCMCLATAPLRCTTWHFLNGVVECDLGLREHA
jgi:hypothetical protein